MNSIKELFANAHTDAELVDAVRTLGVFTISRFNGFINIQTSKTISKANYMRLKNMNNNVYMKTIDFNASETLDNLTILADISLKTNKFSQETLVATKKARLSGEFKSYNRAKKPTVSHDSALDLWMDVVGYPPSAAELAAFKKQHKI